MRNITEIIVHCSATPEGREHTVADIDSWHRKRGWSGIGYHYVVHLDGKVSKGRPIWKRGAHVAGRNTGTIGIVYIGGMDKNMKKPKDTRTPAQKRALVDLMSQLMLDYPIRSQRSVGTISTRTKLVLRSTLARSTWL